MARTDKDTVESIMETGIDPLEIVAIIEFANRMVTTIVGGTTLTEEILTDIETWLTAHLIAMGKERQAKSERINDIWITYQGKFGESLKGTTYGQMVLMLDSTGNFARAMKLKIQINAIPQYPENYD